MRQPSGPAAGIALAFATAAISGFSVYINSHAVRAFGDPSLYTTTKNAIAAALLLALLALATRSRRSGLGEGLTWPLTAREMRGLLAVGIFGGGIPFLLFFEGLARATSADAAFIHKTLVIWVAILAVSFLRERFTLVHAAAVAALMLGQLLSTTGLGAPALDAAAALVLGATLMWAVEVVVAKRLLRRISPLTLGAARMGIGVTVLLGYSIATGDLGSLGAVTVSGWLWAGATGAILTAYVTTWYAALARAQAIDVSAVLVSGAVITAVLARGIDVTLALPTAAGLALIAVGALSLAARSVRASRRSIA